MTTNAYRDFALKLAAPLQFYITPPIRVGEKFPVGFRWKEYQTTPADAAQLQYWARNYPQYNYGIITGPTAGYVFVDCDSMRACSIVSKLCPTTPLIQRSGSGRGVQFGYRYPQNADLYIKTRAKIALDGVPQDIDIRGVGGLVVGPGCKHKSGGTYTMATDWFTLKQEDVPFFDPAWLQLDVTPPKARTAIYTPREAGDLSAVQQVAREHLLTMRGAQAGRGAEKYTLAVAFQLIHGFGLSVDEALPVLLEWGTKRTNVDEYGNYYPWDERDLERKLEYADCHDDKEGRERGYLLPVDEAEILKHL